MSIVIVDPGLRTTNLGDQIISAAVYTEIVEPLLKSGETSVSIVPMHGALSDESRDTLRSADEVVVCGTNLLSNHMRYSSSWQWSKSDIGLTKGKLTVLGAGWWQYQIGRVDPVSAKWMRSLSSGRPWGVRDKYSAERLNGAGIKALHVSCPTLWQVKFQRFPSNERRVIVTFTDYNQDPLADKRLMNLLEDRYDVLYWPQGPGDSAYIRSLAARDVNMLEPSVRAFDYELGQPSTAYVGLRLHGGIRAMQRDVPTLVMSIDNRAREISRSIGLCAPSRHSLREVGTLLAGHTKGVALDMPLANIRKWRSSWGCLNE